MTTTIPQHAIVVGVDGSPQAWEALRWAADRAAVTSRPLHLMHAGGRLAEAFDLTPSRPPIDAVCNEALGRVRGDHPELPVTWSQPIDSPIPALVDASDIASEIVLGTRGLGAVRGAVLGSVTTEVSATANCPVMVVRGDPVDGKSTGPVVVGVDGRPDGVAALDFAFEDAARRGVPLVAVLAWQLDRWDFASGIPMPGGDMKAAHEHHLATLQQTLAEPRSRHPKVEVRTVVECAPTAGSLAQQSVGASLLVVGTRGHRELTGFVLGSVSQAMMRRAACPVAVVAHVHAEQPTATDGKQHSAV
ncbi:universal stress protein [Flexivirga sp. B27]